MSEQGGLQVSLFQLSDDVENSVPLSAPDVNTNGSVAGDRINFLIEGAAPCNKSHFARLQLFHRHQCQLHRRWHLSLVALVALVAWIQRANDSVGKLQWHFAKRNLSRSLLLQSCT